MTLTPDDIEAQQFPVVFRGYKIEDVDAFLERANLRCKWRWCGFGSGEMNAEPAKEQAGAVVAGDNRGAVANVGPATSTAKNDPRSLAPRCCGRPTS